MIKSVATSGRWLTMDGNSPSGPYIPQGNAGSGMVRWSPALNCFEVNDGSNWQTLQMSNIFIDLNYEANEILTWAKKRMQEEQAWERSAQTNPSIKMALDNLNKAKEQLRIISHLTTEHEKTTT